jgi:hypothetical protein
VLCLFHASCDGTPQCSARTAARPARRPVEFIGVYEDRDELVPGLSSARSIGDLHRLLVESNRPGGANIRARLRVSKVLSGGAHLRAGDRLYLIFRSPSDPREPSPLPPRLIGKKLHLVLYDPLKHDDYYGRFSCSEWREADAASGVWIVALARPH